MADYDLLITAGRVVCPATGLDAPGAVAINGDRIVASGPDVRGSAARVVELPEATLLPGLVDLHAHPARGSSRYGIDPDQHLLPRGVTTVLSQGDAGAEDWPAYRAQVVAASITRVRLALHLSRRGERHPEGAFGSLADADVGACVAAVQSGAPLVWGIAFNTSPLTGLDPHQLMRRGMAAADRAGVPVLLGTRMDDDWSLSDQLAQLRAGDVVTYCYHPRAQGLVEGGNLRAGVGRARERGVLFDVGHGMNSFSYAVAERALAHGFAPDTISSDQYVRHVGSQPRHDLALTMSKMIAAGMAETDAFAAVTSRPAQVLGLEGEVGTLAPGACADLVALSSRPRFQLEDTQGAVRIGARWAPLLVVRGGREVAGLTADPAAA